MHYFDALFNNYDKKNLKKILPFLLFPLSASPPSPLYLRWVMRKALGMTSQYRVSTTQFSVPKKRESFHKKSMIIIIDNRLFSDNDKNDCHPAIVLVVVNVKKNCGVFGKDRHRKNDGACVTLRNQLKDLKSVW